MTVTLEPTSSPSSAGPRLLGSTEPRIWTPPLRELTPATSYGFDVDRFARGTLREPLDPWERWLVIHGGELLEDGRPRFRIIIVLVARQNGKTHVLVVLSLYWLFIEMVELVLGTSTKLEYAGESWKKAVRLARKIPELRAEIPRKGGVRKTNGEQTLWRADTAERILETGSRYKIAAANEEGGRSLTISRLVLDELRQHHDYSAWDASEPATHAVPDAQIWGLSNAGSDRSVVLKEWREAALRFIQTGEGDPRVGLFEWSSPPGASPLDRPALAQANPNVGRRKDWDALLGAARTAVQQGGDKLAGFRTEHMCQFVPRLDPAINGDRWEHPYPDGCLDPGTLEDLRDRVVLCFDVSHDGHHATAVAAAVLDDGRARVEPVAAWDGQDAAGQLRNALPQLCQRIHPRRLGWFPAGPAAAVAADLDPVKLGAPDMEIEEIRGDASAACMGFADLIESIQIAQSGDPLLTTQLLDTERLHRGDVWVFVRRGAGHCDASYAAAGATHIARTLPPPQPPLATATAKR